mmetsp:Transcript_29657/g.65706  ORF Transcript_29657/g.65706 Transcript_29657/m.65706 type:complete len:559 (+) Transcript_29657:60-1736(+)
MRHLASSLLFFTLLASVASTAASASTGSSSPSKKTIIGYYASWQWYDRSKLAQPSNMDFTKVDRVNFAFFQTDTNGNIYGTDSWADPQVLFGPIDWNPPPEGDEAKTYKCSWDQPKKKACKHHKVKEGLIHLAHAAGAEIYPSIGGWTLSDAFPAMAASASARSNFASKCAQLVKEYEFDGIDLDWEYPGYEDHSGTPADKANFNLLLDDVRAALDKLTRRTGKKYGLTAALPCGPDRMDDMDIPHVAATLDELNLMTYDFHGAWDAVTGVNAPLYPQGWGPDHFDVDSCVNNWINAGGKREDINIGLPFYGRSFANAQGLKQPHLGTDKGNWRQDEGTPQYFNIMSKLGRMTTVRDDRTTTEYSYFKDGGGMVSYDNEQAICDKTQYVIDHKLNGFIIWELSGDLMPDLSTPLLDAVNAKLASPEMKCGVDSPLLQQPSGGIGSAGSWKGGAATKPAAAAASPITASSIASSPTVTASTPSTTTVSTSAAVESVSPPVVSSGASYYAAETISRCGADWMDANCGPKCSDNSNCPAGLSCWASIGCDGNRRHKRGLRG